MSNLVLSTKFRSPVEIWDDFLDVSKLFSKMINNRKENFLPTLNIKEDDKNVIVTMEIPGMEKKDINIEYEDGVLNVTGVKTEEKTEKNEAGKYIYQEIQSGSFARQVLVGNIDFDKSKAEYKNGVLNLNLPKKEGAKPRKLALN